MACKPKVLFITDDLTDRYGEQIARNYAEWWEITVVEKLSELDNYSYADYAVTMIDYGFIHDENLLRKIHASGTKMAWVGGLPEHYAADAKRMYPRCKFLHNLPCANLSDIGWLLETMLEGE